MSPCARTGLAEFEVRATPSLTEISAGDSVDFRGRVELFLRRRNGARAATKSVGHPQSGDLRAPGSEGYETTDDAARLFDEQGPPAPILLESETMLDHRGKAFWTQRVAAKLPWSSAVLSE